MKAVVIIVLASLVLLAVMLAWSAGETTAFKARCLDAGGADTKKFGTAMSSWVCLTDDGRILDVDGPGL